jgi:hypothetical protein
MVTDLKITELSQVELNQIPDQIAFYTDEGYVQGATGADLKMFMLNKAKKFHEEGRCYRDQLMRIIEFINYLYETRD